MNGDFDLFVLNGKMKELGEKISSINNYIGNLQLGLDSLNIGRPDDMGGTQTTGTVMAKENALLNMIADLAERQKLLSKEQIWGQWASLGTVLDSMALKQNVPKTKIIKVPAGAWFVYMRARIGGVSGTGVSSFPMQGTLTIEGKTYPITISGSTTNATPIYLSMTTTGFNKMGTASGNVMVWDNFIPIYPRFTDGSIEWTMELNTSNESFTGTVQAVLEIFYLVGEE